MAHHSRYLGELARLAARRGARPCWCDDTEMAPCNGAKVSGRQASVRTQDNVRRSAVHNLHFWHAEPNSIGRGRSNILASLLFSRHIDRTDGAPAYAVCWPLSLTFGILIP